jgi:hypothetical protein
MIKKAKYFALHELLPPRIYKHLCDNNVEWKGWLLVPHTTIETIDTLRETLGPMFINTYGLSKEIQSTYGVRVDSGMREMNVAWAARPTYVSAHFHLLATDSVFRDVTAQEARRYILENPDKFPHINRLECTIKGKEIGWLHWDSVPTKERIVELHL